MDKARYIYSTVTWLLTTQALGTRVMLLPQLDFPCSPYMTIYIHLPQFLAGSVRLGASDQMSLAKALLAFMWLLAIWSLSFSCRGVGLFSLHFPDLKNFLHLSPRLSKRRTTCLIQANGCADFDTCKRNCRPLPKTPYRKVNHLQVLCHRTGRQCQGSEPSLGTFQSLTTGSNGFAG